MVWQWAQVDLGLSVWVKELEVGLDIGPEGIFVGLGERAAEDQDLEGVWQRAGRLSWIHYNNMQLYKSSGIVRVID